MAQKSKRSQNNKKLQQKNYLQEVELSESVIFGAFSVGALKYLKRMYWDTPKDVNLKKNWALPLFPKLYEFCALSLQQALDCHIIIHPVIISKND